MAGFLSKIFGGGKKKDGTQEVIENTLRGVIDKSGFDLSFDVKEKEENLYTIEFSGADEELLKEKEGQLLDAFQLFITRVLQHQLPDSKVNVEIDCNGYREAASQDLIELAEKLKDIAITKGKSVYIRALAPKDRKIVHQYLADDDRVRSRSIGDGLYKKIKIYPANMKQGRRGGNKEVRENRDTQ